MHCISEYPNTINNSGLNIIDDYMKKYKCDVGYSDHTGEVIAPIIALTKNVKAVEVHVTFNKEMYGPDVVSSITFDDLKFLSKFREYKNISENKILKKNTLTKRIKNMRLLFSKSYALKVDLKKGSIIDTSKLSLRKPGTGIKEKYKKKLLGKVLKKNFKKNQLLSWSDFK